MSNKFTETVNDKLFQVSSPYRDEVTLTIKGFSLPLNEKELRALDKIIRQYLMEVDREDLHDAMEGSWHV